jgi:1-pyrroline-5-carboxylate dehydrogenase
VFRGLWRDIGANVGEGVYKCIPRVVGETGGKNWHVVHGSAEVRNAVVQTVRGAFEYQGGFASLGRLSLDVQLGFFL